LNDDDPGKRPLVDDDVVQHRVVGDPLPHPVHVGDQHHPLVVFEIVVEDALEDRVQLLQGDGGHEPERPEVHTENGLPRCSHYPRRGKKRPVPPDDDQEIARFRKLRARDGVALMHERRSLFVQYDALSARLEPFAQFGNDLLGSGIDVLGDDSGALHGGLG
jgi:hypothetical protein